MENMGFEIIAAIITLLLGVIGYLINSFITEFRNRMAIFTDSINSLADEVNKLNVHNAIHNEDIGTMKEKIELNISRVNGCSARLHNLEKTFAVLETQHKGNHK